MDMCASDWKMIAAGWKQRCLTHIETLEAITELVKNGEHNENLLNCLTEILKKANFIKG